MPLKTSTDCDQLRRFGPPGSWAVITGASDGIGAEYARQLARHKFNLVLISRTAAKLHALSADIQKSQPAIQLRVHAMDFTQNRDEDFDTIRKLTEDIEVAVLVNNVGVSHDMPVPFTETPPLELRDIVNVNIYGTLRTTQLIAPQMVARRRGLILTIGSFGGLLPTPLLATYSGSKAFLQQWCSGLGAELEPSGVRVQLVQSYLVTSAMSKIRKSRMFVPTPRAFVRSALAKIGRSGGCQGIAHNTTPYWSHALMQYVATTFFNPTNAWAARQNLAMHQGIRKRALKKRQQAKKAF